MSETRLPERARPTWANAALVTVGFVAVLWAIEVVDVVLDNRLDQEGVRPQDTDGLLGVVFAPLLHVGFGHLVANSLPLLVLGFLVLVTGIGRGLAATAVIWVVGGLGTWLVAPEGTVHIGASVLVFGFLSYLILRGFFARRAGEIVIGLLVLFAYGGLLWGVLPGTPGSRGRVTCSARSAARWRRGCSLRRVVCHSDRMRLLIGPDGPVRRSLRRRPRARLRPSHAALAPRQPRLDGGRRSGGRVRHERVDQQCRGQAGLRHHP